MPTRYYHNVAVESLDYPPNYRFSSKEVPKKFINRHIDVFKFTLDIIDPAIGYLLKINSQSL